ncbi:MAG: hypothetical protein LBS97_03100 [Treponema sp.]|jgi:hypothetical protein|nr:hypothetical protein [Treponema sp.]
MREVIQYSEAFKLRVVEDVAGGKYANAERLNGQQCAREQNSFEYRCFFP